MQISRIYSNRPEVFSPIDFNCRTYSKTINVIFGDVRHPKDRKKDSHNLGKTTLCHLIDFLMLKGLAPDHFLHKNQERFKAYVFFIEIALNSGLYATVRRSVAFPNKVSLKKHELGGQNFSAVEPIVPSTVAPLDNSAEPPPSSTETAPAEPPFWDHPELSREDAVRLLDGWLDLRILKPYDYRQAITYFLRTQADYRDELQLQKFAAGKDRAWKPFVAHLFGFNETPVRQKYELDEAIEDLKRKQADQQSTVAFREEQLPELAARISVALAQVNELEDQLDAFNFDEEEKRIVRNLVDDIETKIAEANDRLYNLRYDIQQIDAALNHRDRFDLNEVEEVFKETGLHFPHEIKRGYEDLVAFNKKVTHERNTSLRSRRKELAAEEEAMRAQKTKLDERRQAELKVLRSTDTFEKFKELQKELAKQRAQLVYFEEQRKLLELVAATASEVREAERNRGRVVDEVKAMVLRPTPVFEKFQALFNSYCQRVLNHDGIFFFHVNSNNNFDYTIGLQIVGQSTITSSLSEGTSYKKLLCALFDLALLKVYEDAPFFHFVYHDGIFESLDDRKKISLLEIVHEQLATGKTQYILTLIDSDMPRDDQGQKLAFSEDEIVLRLHDDGNDGRLFKMAEF